MPISRQDDIPTQVRKLKNAIQQGISDITEATERVKEKAPALLSTIEKTAADIGSAALAISGTCQSTGSTGGFAALTETCYIQWFFQRIVDQDPDHYGYPLCAVRKINTLSGFVLCANEGDLEVAATPAERQAITALMEAGFYYE